MNKQQVIETLGRINRTRTAAAGVMSEEELNKVVTVRNRERKLSGTKVQTYVFMNAEQLKQYRNNVIEAIERNEERIDSKGKGGLPQSFTFELLEELFEILEGVDAKLDESEAAATTEADTFEGLTEKEAAVLMAIVEHSECEYGLPCDKKAVAKTSGVRGKSLSGVIASLTKKGIVEPYEADDFDGEFFLTEEYHEKLL